MIVAFVIMSLYILLAYLFGDWKNWKLYHATLLYIVVMNLTYELLTYKHSLWQFKPGLIPNHTLTSFLTIFIVLPAIVLIYLSHFPTRKFLWKAIYISCWVFVSTFLEWIFRGNFIYDHGWGLGWSFGFYWLMYLMVRLHHKKPLWAYTLSIPCILFFLLYFKIPIESMK